MEPVSGSLTYGHVERELNEQFTAFEESAKTLMEFARDFFMSRFMCVQGNYLDFSGSNGYRNLTNEEVQKFNKILSHVIKTDRACGSLNFKTLVLDVHFKALQVLNKVKEVMPHNQDFAKINRKNYELMINDLYKEARELALDLEVRPGIYTYSESKPYLVPIYNAEASRFLDEIQKLRCLPYK